MKLHCLGTAGYHPSETRHTASFFIPEHNLLLDAGTGVFRLQPLIMSREVSILLSHAHLDHVVGLTFLWDVLSGTPLERIHVYAEEEKIEQLKAHLFHPSLFPATPPLIWHPLTPSNPTFQVGRVRCRWFPLDHPGGSVGYYLEFPEVSLAYVTDTTSLPDSPYWKSIQGVDWLIHECNFVDSEKEMAIHTGHSWTTAVLENAYRHGIRRLILTHFNPLAHDDDPIDLVGATARLRGKTPEQILLANDSDVIELSRL
ncbi:MAG: MBL fold metallo-hydrolase [Planctomycetota bacterium]|jgi:ribonuclease BN (tRNA processing enzyme)